MSYKKYKFEEAKLFFVSYVQSHGLDVFGNARRVAVANYFSKDTSIISIPKRNMKCLLRLLDHFLSDHWDTKWGKVRCNNSF